MNILKTTGSFTIIDCITEETTDKLTKFLSDFIQPEIGFLICKREITLANEDLEKVLIENKELIQMLYQLLDRRIENIP